MLRHCVITAVLLTPTVAAAQTVEDAVSGGCSTTQVEGLSLQIIEQGNCIAPGAFVEVPNKPNVNFGGAVLPYMEEPARDALVTALDANTELTMQINSMLRTVAQQYLLYRWYQLGLCGIGLAAQPGNSNHETGLAIDISDNATWRSILEGQGFQWFGAGDPVHFDYVGPGAVDYKGTDVLAFQQLWNINNPSDLIDEDGDYGGQTETRMKQTPAAGFAIGADCGPDPEGDLQLSVATSATDVFSDGPSAGIVDAFVGETYSLTVTVSNAGDGPAASADVALSLPDEFLAADQPSLALGSIEPGASAEGVFTLTALAYSADLAPLVGNLSVSNESEADATVSFEVDIYSERRFTWDGGRLEGWLMGTVTPESELDGHLALEGPADAISVERNDLSVPLSAGEGITITARRSTDLGIPTLITTIDTDAGGVIDLATTHEIDLPGDGAWHTVRITDTPAGTLTRLRFYPFADATVDEVASAAIDELTIGDVAPPSSAVDDGIPGGNSGCSCQARGDAGAYGAAGWACLLALLLLLRNRRRDAHLGQ